ncbi:hypothetical protein ACFQO6_09370 [Nocardioides astragali]|uniref:Uncharacterized protein n=1 Tax=Nocardioides astragali TaxID=1776736 RepID=A0ABW2N322_9ACTN
MWDVVYAWDNDDSLFCVNMVGFCENDWDQLGEIMDRIRVAQGIWDAGGEMRGDYVLMQSYYLCVT